MGWGGLVILVLVLAQAVKAQDKAEGKKYYVTYCSGCHGETGKGDGAAAVSLPVKPTNHSDGTAMNQIPDKVLGEIISKGGQAVGKSPFMPGWGSQLNDKQVRDMVAYVRSLATPPTRPPASKKRQEKIS
jgi:mono/diheme cytochrome c family protein